MFKEAKEYGEKLIAIIGRDENIEKMKGIEPMHNENERLEIIQHIDLVDLARLGDKKDVYKVILEEKPDIIALGYDQKYYIDKLSDAITKAGLNTQIVRLSEYESKRLKTNKIKKYIERMI
jgi:FAD synthetase